MLWFDTEKAACTALTKTAKDLRRFLAAYLQDDVTAKYYAQPEAMSGAKSACVLDLLDDAPPDPALAELSAEQLARSIPPATLAKLLALLTDSASVEKNQPTIGG